METLQPYRVALFNVLSKRFDITVVCNNKKDYLESSLLFNVINVEVNKFGPFLYHKGNIFKKSKEFDVVVGLMNIRFIDIMLLALNPFRKFKVIFWGIGVNASYNKKFDSHDFSFYIRILLNYFADSLVFYSDYPIKKHLNFGFNGKSLFVANNTVEINSYIESSILDKQHFLFIGTLYAQKGLSDLFEIYFSVYKELNGEIPDLVVIGDGPDLAELKQKADNLNLSHKIKFKGKIQDGYLISEYFKNTIITISPYQAGLSALTSMGNGVPFVTSKHAITGGELFNIENNVNGMLFENNFELKEIIKDASLNREKYFLMGKNAREFYEKNRTIDIMASGIIDAIDFAKTRD